LGECRQLPHQHPEGPLQQDAPPGVDTFPLLPLGPGTPYELHITGLNNSL
jgi:hypothetical protein